MIRSDHLFLALKQDTCAAGTSLRVNKSEPPVRRLSSALDSDSLLHPTSRLVAPSLKQKTRRDTRLDSKDGRQDHFNWTRISASHWNLKSPIFKKDQSCSSMSL
jgi:hypothetical protein